MTKLFFTLFITLVFSAFIPKQSYSGELSISVGEGKSRWYFKDEGELPSQAYRIGYIHPTDYEWQFKNTTYIKLELEAGIYHWSDTWLDKDKYGVYINPMWRYYVPIWSQKVYFGAGIGLSYTNDDHLIDRELGSRILFEDKFEAGLVIANKHRISISVNHYSNANLADVNHGVNFYYFNYAYSL
ncbi:MAG: hypothetical protein ACJAVV_001586 [Alphaproteobacteria bacterium]|jgi:hypothetical protein